MQLRRLGRTGLVVSEIGMGTMTFGTMADERESVRILDAAFDAGVQVLDVAEVYPVPPRAEYAGRSEEICGKWLAGRSRDQIVVATKIAGPGQGWFVPAVRSGATALDRHHVERAIEGSLRRLGTDYIDLYQTHWYDDETPIEETMAALDSLVRQGKVRYVGCSNYPAWRLMQALWACDKGNLVRYDSIQPHYSLVHRAEFEREVQEVCVTYGIGVIPYSPLAGGFLTGKYTRESDTSSARADGIKRRYFNEVGWRTIDAVRAVAAESGSTPTAVALAWLLAQPAMTAPIIGANSVGQLQESLAAGDLVLTAEQLATLNAASKWQGGESD